MKRKKITYKDILELERMVKEDNEQEYAYMVSMAEMGAKMFITPIKKTNGKNDTPTPG